MTRRQCPAWLRRRLRGAVARTAMDDLGAALAARDGSGIRAVLHPGVALVIDSGGRMPESSTSMAGDAAASAALAALMTAETAVTAASINGVPGLVLMRNGAVAAAVMAETRSGLLSSVWVVCTPDKLRHWNRRLDG